MLLVVLLISQRPQKETLSIFLQNSNKACFEILPLSVDHDPNLGRDTNKKIVFDENFQRSEFNLSCQFDNLKLVVTENYVFHELVTSDFDGPTRVYGEVSLTPHNDDAEIAELFPCLFNQSSLANIADLAMYESMTDCLHTCYWCNCATCFPIHSFCVQALEIMVIIFICHGI